MRYLVDTHLLLWAAGFPGRLPSLASEIFEDVGNELMFSVLSVWEVAIKSSLGRADFRTEPRTFRLRLLDSGFEEIAITSEHAATVASLPLIHRDPFDRLLVAQALVEGVTLLTADKRLAEYPAMVRRV